MKEEGKSEERWKVGKWKVKSERWRRAEPGEACCALHGLKA
jgi:hypothetical protein